MPSDPSDSRSHSENLSSREPTPAPSTLNSGPSRSAQTSSLPAPTPEPLESDEDIHIPEDKFAHRIQPFPEPFLIFCHWMLYTWGAAVTLGCLYALGLGEGQMRGRENVWVDIAVEVGSLGPRMFG